MITQISVAVAPFQSSFAVGTTHTGQGPYKYSNEFSRKFHVIYMKTTISQKIHRGMFADVSQIENTAVEN